MWSDNESELDLLRFRYIAEAITKIIKQEHLLPVTVGIFGDWGSGKSTLMRMVKDDFVKPGALVVEFNGWLFEDYEDAKSALLGSILDEIAVNTKGNQGVVEGILTRLRRFVSRIDVGKGLGLAAKTGILMLLGMPQLSVLALPEALRDVGQKAKDDPEKAFETLGGLLKPEESAAVRHTIRSFRADFEKLLKEAEITQLVVLIDDLDRCLPKTIIETLEAIKLFLFVPRSAFVIGADEDLIRYAIRQVYTNLDADGREVGRDYLEKLIQIPVSIPPLSRVENHAYINLLFAQKHLMPDDFKKVLETIRDFVADDLQTLSFDVQKARDVFKDELHKVTKELDDDLGLSAQIAKVALPGLQGSPRRTKRFLNSLMLRIALSQARGMKLDSAVLAKLMSLEYIRPLYFKQLADLQAAQEGQAKELAASEAEVSVKKPKEVEAPTKPEPKRQGADPEESTEQSKDAESTWLVDAWMRVWLGTEPMLAGQDLRPYFFIAHDKAGILDTLPNALSPKAQIALQDLVSENPVQNKRAIASIKNLGETDIAAIINGFAEKIKQSSPKDAGRMVTVLLNLTEQKIEILPQTIGLLQSLPHQKIPVSAVLAIDALGKSSQSQSQVHLLLRSWRDSPSNRNLANTARSQLEKAEKAKRSN